MKSPGFSLAKESCGSMARLEACIHGYYCRDSGDLRGVVDGAEQSTDDDLDRGDPQGRQIGKVVIKRPRFLSKRGQGSTVYNLDLF